MTMRHFGVGVILALAACTADNPLYTPGISGDLAGSSDLQGQKDVDLAGPPNKVDMAGPMACMIGERTCLANNAAGCRMGAFVKDRTCPTGSTCADGHCAAPSPGTNNLGKNCAPTGTPTESLCVAGVSGGSASTIPSCEPFIDPAAPTDGKVVWACAPPIGMGVSGTPCTEGSQCRSGFCGSNGTCFRSCITAADCPSSGSGGGWKCSVVSITVEGSMLMASSCVM